MRRPERLTRRRDFASIYRRGRQYRSHVIVLRLVHTERPVTRFGLVTSRELGNAVVRNRVKRRLREIARSLPVKPGCDIVISARRGAATADYQRLKREVKKLMSRAGALTIPNGESPR